MSRNITKTKNNYLNYLTLPNNCKILQNGAKPLNHLNPQNILTQNIRQIWVSYQLPASCILDLRNLKQKPLYFNKIGFNCWHQYQSNPKLIQIQYTSQDSIQNAHWSVLTKIRLQLIGGWQHFKIPLIFAKSISYLKIIIVQNHEQKTQDQQLSHQNNFQQKVYLNQISMGFVQQTYDSRIDTILNKVDTLSNQNGLLNNNILSREKTFSDYRKLTTSQKQIKKLTDKVKFLSNQNQVIKRTIDHQNNIIIKLQQAMKSLTQSVQKLQKIQSLQQHQLRGSQETSQPRKKKLQNKKPKDNDSVSKNKIYQFFNDESQIINSIQSKQKSKESNDQKKKSKQRLYSRHNSIYQQQQQSQFSKKNSIFQSGKGKSHQKSNQSKKRNQIIAHVDPSQNSLSEYEDARVDERKYHIKGKGTRQSLQQKQKQIVYYPLIQKLHTLMVLRDKKKRKLHTHEKNRHSRNQQAYSEEQYGQQQSIA